MKAIIGIGLPGSGKTTYLRSLAETKNMAYVNADDIRQEITGNPSDHTQEPKVWALLYERLSRALKTRDVVVDATHVKPKDRRRMINFCREHGATQIIGYWFDVSLPVCKLRNSKRDRRVPEPVMDVMSARLVQDPPSIDDGFDDIAVIK